MPSKSKEQQRFFYAVYNYKKNGKLPDDKEFAKKIKKTADDMSMSDIKDFLKIKKEYTMKRIKLRKIVNESQIVKRWRRNAEEGGVADLIVKVKDKLIDKKRFYYNKWYHGVGIIKNKKRLFKVVFSKRGNPIIKTLDNMYKDAKDNNIIRGEVWIYKIKNNGMIGKGSSDVEFNHKNFNNKQEVIDKFTENTEKI